MNSNGSRPAVSSLVTALARQNWPAATFTRSVIGIPVGLLAIAIMIVAPPARPLRQFAFANLVNHRDGIDHQRIIGSANA